MRILFFPDNDMTHNMFLQRIEKIFFEIHESKYRSIINYFELEQINMYIQNYFESIPASHEIKLFIKNNIHQSIENEKLDFINVIKSNFYNIYNDDLEYDIEIFLFKQIEILKLHDYIEEKIIEDIISKKEYIFWELMEFTFFRKRYKKIFKKYILSYSDSVAKIVNYVEEIEKDRIILDMIQLGDIKKHISEKIESNLLDIYALKKLNKLRVGKNKLGIDEVLLEKINQNLEAKLRLTESALLFDYKKEIKLDLSLLQPHNPTDTIRSVFRNQAQFLNSNGCVQLLSTPNRNTSIADLMGDYRDDEYRTTPTFQFCLDFSVKFTRQIDWELKERYHTTIEQLLINFYKNVIPDNEIKIVFSSSSDYKDRNNKIGRQIETVINCYYLYQKNKIIDNNLLKYLSNTLSIDKLKSLHINKNYYVTDSFLCHYKGIQRYLFSNQSNGYIFSENKSFYQNLFEIIINENLYLSTLDSLLTDDFNFLVDRDIIIIENDIIRFKDIDFIKLLYFLYLDECVTYTNLNDNNKVLIDNMVEKEFLSTDNLLFSKEEIKFFNFMLYNKTFSNNLGLRNKYSHVEVEVETNEMIFDYYCLINMLILIGLKIQDDLTI